MNVETFPESCLAEIKNAIGSIPAYACCCFYINGEGLFGFLAHDATQEWNKEPQLK